MRTSAVGSSSLVPYRQLRNAKKSSLRNEPAKTPQQASAEKMDISGPIRPVSSSISFLRRLPRRVQAIAWPLILLYDVLRREDSGVWSFMSTCRIFKKMPDHSFLLGLTSGTRGPREKALREVIDEEYETSLEMPDDYEKSIRDHAIAPHSADLLIGKVRETIKRRLVLRIFSEDLREFSTSLRDRPSNLQKSYLAKRLLSRMCGSNKKADQREFISQGKLALDQTKIERRFTILIYRQYITNPELRNGEGVESIRSLVSTTVKNAKTILSCLEGIIEATETDEYYSALPDGEVWPFIDSRLFPFSF